MEAIADYFSRAAMPRAVRRATGRNVRIPAKRRAPPRMFRAAISNRASQTAPETPAPLAGKTPVPWAAKSLALLVDSAGAVRDSSRCNLTRPSQAPPRAIAASKFMAPEIAALEFLAFPPPERRGPPNSKSVIAARLTNDAPRSAARAFRRRVQKHDIPQSIQNQQSLPGSFERPGKDFHPLRVVVP